jgi:hypothetical protein
MQNVSVLKLNPPLSVRVRLNPKLGFGVFWIFSFLFIFLLSVFFIFQISQMTQVDYSRNQLEKELKELSQVNEGLRLNFSQTSSLENIELILAGLNYEKVGRVYYLRAGKEHTALMMPRTEK